MLVGPVEGLRVAGFVVGPVLGLDDGDTVGEAEGSMLVGGKLLDGLALGLFEGREDGFFVGALVGLSDGSKLGSSVGSTEGHAVGALVGLIVGIDIFALLLVGVGVLLPDRSIVGKRERPCEMDEGLTVSAGDVLCCIDGSRVVLFTVG